MSFNLEEMTYWVTTVTPHFEVILPLPSVPPQCLVDTETLINEYKVSPELIVKRIAVLYVARLIEKRKGHADCVADIQEILDYLYELFPEMLTHESLRPGKFNR